MTDKSSAPTEVVGKSSTMAESATKPAAKPTAKSMAKPTATPPGPWPLAPWLTVALAMGAVVAGVTVGALLRPVADSLFATKYSGQQINDAKTNICAAYGRVHQAVLVTTGKDGGEDVALRSAIAANARMALYDGGEYLLTKLDGEPAAAPDLADAVRTLAGAYQQLALDYLAEVPDAESQASLHALDNANGTVFQMCQNS